MSLTSIANKKPKDDSYTLIELDKYLKALDIGEDHRKAIYKMLEDLDYPVHKVWHDLQRHGIKFIFDKLDKKLIKE